MTAQPAAFQSLEITTKLEETTEAMPKQEDEADEGPDPTPLLSRDDENSEGEEQQPGGGGGGGKRNRSENTQPLELDGSNMSMTSASASSSSKVPKGKKPPPSRAFALLSPARARTKTEDSEMSEEANPQDQLEVDGGGEVGSYCDADPALDEDCQDDYDDGMCPLPASLSCPNFTHGGSYSLALSPSTPPWTVPLISTLMLLTHALFLYGQLAPMWRLRVTADVDVWANASTTLSRRTFDALGLDRDTHYVLNYDDDVSTFTYGFAIKQLWAAAGLPSKTTSRLAAALLIIFSGVWPHLKLLLLHASWYVPRRERSRTASLYWLGAFGKWTLADVFVVCVMIGIVNLDWAVDPTAVRDGLSEELPTLVTVAKSMYTSSQACTKILGFECGGDESFGHRAKCWGCEAAVNEAYTHPDWARGAGRNVLQGVNTDGGGAVTLRVAGMRGIYPFCAAAILSLLLGVAVDLLDHRARVRSSTSGGGGTGGYVGQQPLFSPSFSPSSPPPSAGGRFALLINRVLARRGPHRRIETYCQLVTAWVGYGVLVGAALLTALLVGLACTVPTMEREVIGAIPTVVHDVLGIAWERPYSLKSLVEVSGALGGPDYLLMGTFAIFVLVGPVLRSALVVLNLVVPLTEAGHELVSTAVNFVGAFCAWEVFAIAVVMIDDLVPSVTNTILQKPVCEQLSPDEDGSCLEIEFNLLPDSFVGLLVLGGTLLVLVSTIAVKLGFRAVDPYRDGDEGGPYCRELCPRRGDSRADPANGREENAYIHLGEDDMASDTEILL